MNQDKYAFSQLSTFLHRTQFNNYVRKYNDIPICETFHLLEPVTCNGIPSPEQS